MKRGRQSQAGLTLVEMMVALVIGMVLSIAVMMVLSTFEGRRRTLGSTSDLDQSGALAMFQLDRWIRSAGTGLGQGSGFAYGCTLYAAKSGHQILPATGPLPAPFASVDPGSSGVFRLAPVLILPGQTTPNISGKASDVLVVMSAGNDASQVPSVLSAPPSADHLATANLTEFSPGDVLLVADHHKSPGGGPADCMIAQASASLTSTGTGTTLPLGGSGSTYDGERIGSAAITSLTDDPVAFDLGAPTASGTGQPPVFQLIGVGDNDTLYGYDLLQVSGDGAQAQAEGVFEMHAVYGIDSTGSADNKIDQWVGTGASSGYSVAALSDGSMAAMTRLKNIRAVRVALVLRTSLPEKGAVTPQALTMFPDLSGLAVTRTLTSAEQHFRYRVVETTIPIRNNGF
ncbi:MAG: PilW family protein [Burkholderiales bacterium]|nr:PilW family protein [Burkholderiales bacterium]